MPVVDPAWAEQTAAAAGIPVAAVTAYGRATLLAPAVVPSRLDHAGRDRLGRVPARHHRRPGARQPTALLRADPRPGARRRGPGRGHPGAARGRPGTATATGTTRSARCSSSPSTWETWGADGDGDGAADPHDIDDAAYAAARYLCADGHDLSTGEGWAAAVLSYNHATSYLEAVHPAASTYAARTS